jgi:predicted dehydrogenase
MQPAINACKNLELKAIYSRSLKSAQTLGQDLSGIELYSEDSGDEKNYAALLKKGGIDAVIIAYVYISPVMFEQY